MKPATDPAALREALDAYTQAEHHYNETKAAFERAREVWLATGDRKRAAEAELIKLIKAQKGAVQDGDHSWTVERDRLRCTRIACALPPPELALTNAA